MLHVEGGFALPLGDLHARIEGAQRHHVAQAFNQLLVRQFASPGADSFAIAVENTDDRKCQIADFLRIGIDGRTAHRTRFGNVHIGKIRLAAGTHGRFRHVQA